MEKNEVKKIEVVCSDCGKKFKTTQEWFDARNKDGKLPCRKCRFSKFPPKKEKPTNQEPSDEIKEQNNKVKNWNQFLNENQQPLS
jgi:DNA-directed RNA polymerase subunit RPC12/RpoP